MPGVGSIGNFQNFILLRNGANDRLQYFGNISLATTNFILWPQKERKQMSEMIIIEIQVVHYYALDWMVTVKRFELFCTLILLLSSKITNLVVIKWGSFLCFKHIFSFYTVVFLLSPFFFLFSPTSYLYKVISSARCFTERIGMHKSHEK